MNINNLLIFILFMSVMIISFSVGKTSCMNKTCKPCNSKLSENHENIIENQINNLFVSDIFSAMFNTSSTWLGGLNERDMHKTEVSLFN